MKEITILLYLLISVNSFSQEKGYWSCFAFTVEKQSDAAELVSAMDGLFNSEVMSNFPMMVTLAEIEYKNSNNSATHQICFIGQNADAFVGWGSGPPPTAEGKLLMEIFEKVAVPSNNVLGSPLIFDPSNLKSYEYGVVWSLDVKNIPEFANIASDFIKVNSNSFDGVIELHEAISGAEDNVSHYMVARSNNLSDWLKGREAVFANKKSEKFFENAPLVSNTINSFSVRLLKVY